MNILIVGDSFSADWSAKYNDYPGWPNMLAKKFNVTNLSQAGCSEYKILNQLKSVDDLDQFDLIIISHTSPSRIFTPRHPIHYNDRLHHSCDLFFTDLEYHCQKIKNLLNRSLHSARNFFKFHYDDDFYLYIYNKIIQDIDNIVKNKPVVVSNLHDNNLNNYKYYLDFSTMLSTHSGKINHFSHKGNDIIYKRIIKIINDPNFCKQN
jgi:hypothetical protein